MEGISLLHAEHFQMAVDVLTKCLTLDVNNKVYNASIMYERGGAFLGLSGREKDAIDDLETCLRLQPEHSMAVVRLAKARVQLESSRTVSEHIFPMTKST